MSARRGEPANVPWPSPFPEGWYLVSSRQAVLKPILPRRLGWGIMSSSGVTGSGVLVLPVVFARTWAYIWGPPREGAYMVAGSSVPSMALSTMQPATALPLPLPTHQVREVASLRDTRGRQPYLRLVGGRGTGAVMEPASGPARPGRLEQSLDPNPSLCRSSPGGDGKLNRPGPHTLRPRVQRREPHRANVGGRALSPEPLRLQGHPEDREDRTVQP